MTTTIALGNSPSAGSTFFSDLLDSTTYTAVGPELNLFSLEYLYDFKNFKNKLKRISLLEALGQPKQQAVYQNHDTQKQNSHRHRIKIRQVAHYWQKYQPH